MSVVTPVYNGEAYLAECIRSVLRQTYRHWEYVILDNASSDRSFEVAREFAAREPRIRLQRNGSTLPFVQNWNRALLLTSPQSRYCKVVHADDLLFPECLERMVGVAERNPSAGIVGSWVQRGDEAMCRWHEAPGELIPGRELGRLSLLGEIPYLFGSPTSLLLRSDLVRAADHFYTEEETELIDQVVDQDACYRILRKSDFGYVRKVLTYTRDHADSITARNARVRRWYVGKILLLLRHGPQFLSSEERERRLEEWLTRYHQFLAGHLFRRRGRAFWRFHRRALSRLGYPLRRAQLVRVALGLALRRAVRALERRMPRVVADRAP